MNFCIELLHGGFIGNFNALNFCEDMLHEIFESKNRRAEVFTVLSRSNLKLKAQSTEFLLSFFPIKLGGKTNALFGILL